MCANPLASRLPLSLQASAAIAAGAVALAESIAANNFADPAVLFVGGVAQAAVAVAIATAEYAAAPGPITAAALNATQQAHAALLATSYSCAYDTVGLGINCAQLLDVAAWLNYVAQVLVFEDTFQNRGVVVYNPATPKDKAAVMALVETLP